MKVLKDYILVVGSYSEGGAFHSLVKIQARSKKKAARKYARLVTEKYTRPCVRKFGEWSKEWYMADGQKVETYKGRSNETCMHIFPVNEYGRDVSCYDDSIRKIEKIVCEYSRDWKFLDDEYYWQEYYKQYPAARNEPSRGDYSPSCPWNAPGMSVRDFI